MHVTASSFNVSLYRQSTKYSCGPASLRIALSLVGLECEEQWLMRRMGTAPHIGTRPAGFREALRLLGVSFFETENANIDDVLGFVSIGLPVIVAWNYDGDGHYSVIANIPKRGILKLIDPLKGEVIKMNVRKFLKLWRDPCNDTTRWMLVLIRSMRQDNQSS